MKTKLALIAIAVVLALLLVVPASAENVYVDRNPALYEVLPMDAYGYVVFYIRAGGSAQDLNIWIKNDAIGNATFDPTYHPDKTVIVGQNPHFQKVVVRADGVSDIIGPLAAGCWTAYIQKGNGDQMEEQHFKIGGGATERVMFLGSAVSSAGERACKPVYKILDASYGSGTCYYITIVDKEAWDETIVDKEAWDETVVDKEAWDETVVDQEAYDEIIHHPAETHVVHHEAITHQETVVDVPAWDETIVDTPAYDEVIHHDAVTHTVHHPAVPAVPAWTEYFGDYAKDGSHYNYVGSNLADYDVTFKNVGDWHGDYSKDGNHYNYAGHDWGKYDVDTAVNVGHVVHPAIPAVPAWDEVIVDVPAWDETIHHGAVTHIEHHDAITHEITVVDQEAYDETVVDKEAWDETIHHDAVTHVVHHPAETHIVHHPAETHVVHHPAETHQELVCNEMVDMTSVLQGIVSGGHTRFAFASHLDKAGIFSDDFELLYLMRNPSAPGTLNSATITYEDGCGKSNTISAPDFCLFDLGKGNINCQPVDSAMSF